MASNPATSWRLRLVVVVAVGAACQPTPAKSASPDSNSTRIYAPSPSVERLAKTESAGSGARVSTTVPFCADEQGTVVDVEVVESSGDAEVDEIVSQTVETWRLQPYLEDGVPTRACTSETFDFDFQFR